MTGVLRRGQGYRGVSGESLGLEGVGERPTVRFILGVNVHA